MQTKDSISCLAAEEILVNATKSVSSLKVLMSIVGDADGIGISPLNGVTKEYIKLKSGISISTVNRAIKVLLDTKLIGEGIKKMSPNKKGYMKTYYVTDLGFDVLTRALELKRISK